MRQETCICCYDLSLSQAPCWTSYHTFKHSMLPYNANQLFHWLLNQRNRNLLQCQSKLGCDEFMWVGLLVSNRHFPEEFSRVNFNIAIQSWAGFRMPPLNNLLLQRTIISLPFTSIAFKRKPVISISHTLVLKQRHPLVCLYLQISQPLSVSLKHLRISQLLDVRLEFMSLFFEFLWELSLHHVWIYYTGSAWSPKLCRVGPG